MILTITPPHKGEGQGRGTHVMKQKLFIFAGLALLLVIIIYIAKDLFYGGTGDKTNPYEYDLEKLKKSDSLFVAYKEVQQIPVGLEEIHGIAIDQSDNLYVSGKNGIAVFDGSGKLQKKIALEGTGWCIKVDLKGNIYIGMEDHIEIFDANGKRTAKWETVNQNSILTGIALKSKDLFVADAGEKAVYHYDLKGKMINRIGEKDPQNNIPGFFIPSPYFDLGIDPSGKLWIVDPGRHTINQFSFDGKLISSWGKTSIGVEGFCGCCNPSNIAFLSDGSFVTSEKSIERIKIYSPDGKYRYLVAKPDQFEEGTRGLDLAVDSKDRIIVLDPVKKLIRIFVHN